MTTGLPVTVIGGYLGAGKTTLLNRMLTQTQGRRIAVVVNDFGELGIDASLVAAHDGETISLVNGCMCCSAADGTAAALARVMARGEAFDHVAIEASGVAEPGRIAQTAEAFGLVVDGIVVVVDAEQVQVQAANRYVGDSVLRQLAQADLLLVNKIDLLTAPRRAEVGAWLGAVVGGTPRLETVQANAPAEVLLGASAGNLRRGADGIGGHGRDYRTWVVERGEGLDRATFAALVEDLCRSAIRAKGFVLFGDAPGERHLYQQVGRRWSMTAAGDWQGAMARTAIVAIGLAAQASARASASDSQRGPWPSK
jgi:G3E family GTPase